MSEYTCRLCQAKEFNDVLCLPRVPRNVTNMLEESQCSNEPEPISIRVLKCCDCGLVQTAQVLADEFYVDSFWTASHIKQMVSHQKQQATNFIINYNLQGKRVVDVGCGDGNYLDLIRQAGALAFGVEPALAEAEVAIKEHNLTVFTNYVTRNLPVPYSPYDAFVTRQVLEHIPDINDFLQGIRESLTLDGIGLIEVPNFEQTLVQQRFYDFFVEHVNYFTERTLRLAVEQNGFKVLEIVHSMNGEYLEAYVKVDSTTEIDQLQLSSDNLLNNLKIFLANSYKEGKKVALWGAGIKGVTILSLLEENNIAYVIDSDPLKHGKFTPVSHLLVRSPQESIYNPVDIIIITAMTYFDEIVDQLRNEIKFTGDIFYLDRGDIRALSTSNKQNS